MFVTIRNLTDEPIVAETPCSKAPIRLWPNLVLQPSCPLTTNLPRGELILHASCPHTDVQNLAFSDNEKAPDLEEGRFFDLTACKISLPTIFTASWNVIPLPSSSKWRVFYFKVCYPILVSNTIDVTIRRLRVNTTR